MCNRTGWMAQRVLSKRMRCERKSGPEIDPETELAISRSFWTATRSANRQLSDFSAKGAPFPWIGQRHQPALLYRDLDRLLDVLRLLAAGEDHQAEATRFAAAGILKLDRRGGLLRSFALPGRSSRAGEV